MKEFSGAMETSIKPMLDEHLKVVVENVQMSLLFANKEFSNKLRTEEEKNKNIMEYYMSKLEQVMEQQHNISQSMTIKQ